MTYFTNTSEIAGRLRALASRIDTDEAVAPIWVSVDLQATAAHEDESERIATVDHLVGLLGITAARTGSSQHAALGRVGDVVVDVYTGVLKPTPELDAAKARIKELEAELAAKFTAPVEPPPALAQVAVAGPSGTSGTLPADDLTALAGYVDQRDNTPPAALAAEFPAQLERPKPAIVDYTVSEGIPPGAVRAEDVEGDTYVVVDATGGRLRSDTGTSWYVATLVTAGYGPVRWFDADGQQIAVTR